MKTRNANRNWMVACLLGLMFFTLRLVFADFDCSTTYGCAGVSVSIQGAVWAQGECPPDEATAPNAKDIPVMTCRCDSLTANVKAFASDINLYHDPETGDCMQEENFVQGSCNVNVGKTGCEVYTTNYACGWWKVIISKPKRSGVVKITARADGECVECPEVVEDMCDDCDVVPHTWQVIGVIQVDIPEDEEDGGGSGSGGGCGNGSCGDKDGTQGTGSVGNDSVNFKLHLGRANAERTAGYLQLYAETPSSALYLPSALTVPFERPGVEVLTSAGEIKQVKSPQGLVHVAVKDANEYHLQVFYDSSLTRDGGGNYVMSGGFYTTNTSAYVTWIVKNPDGGTPWNRLWITEQRDGSTRDFKYTYTSGSLKWDLLQPDGSTTLSTWMEAVTPGGDTTNYFRQITFVGTTMWKKQTTYKWVTALSDKVVTQEIEGDGGVTRTTTYTYYSGSADTGSENKLQRIDYPEGNWVYYKYDHVGRCTNEFSTYGNSTPPTSGDEPDPVGDNCRLTEYTYSLNSSDDGVDDSGTYNPTAVRRTVVKLPAEGEMREVSRTYHRFTSTTYDESETCPLPSAHWGDTGNLRTGTTKDSLGRITSVSHPDGTTTTYTYDTYNTNNVVRHLSSSNNGTETTTVTDELGYILARTNRAVAGGVGGIVLARELYNYKDGGNYLDALRRSYDVTDLAGRTTKYRNNSCCGMDYTVSPDGVTNYVVRDSLLKWELGTSNVVEVVSGTVRSIQITNKLDALGRVLFTKRVGTNGNVITQQQFSYDILGRLMRQTNALLGVTSYTNTLVSSRLVTTNTAPDGGTHVNWYYRDGNQEMTTGTAEHGLKYVYGVAQDGTGGPWRRFVKEVKLDTSGSETSEYVTNFVDGIGRTYKTIYSTNGTVYPYRESFYNSYGQLSKEIDPDGVITLYEYNSLGERERTILDVDQDGVDEGGSDRITKTARSYVAAADGKPDLVRTDTSVWKDGDSTGTLVSRSEVSTDGLKTWRTVYKNAADTGTAVTSSTETALATSGNGWTRTQTSTAPEGISVASVFKYGLLNSVTRYDSTPSTPVQIGKTTYAYDAHNRQFAVTDARNGTTTYAFNDADQVTSVTTPGPGTIGGTPQSTTTSYNLMLQATNVVQADGGSVTNEYYLTGELKRTYGARTYPVGYGYDYAGRMIKMTNWTTFSVSGSGSGRRVTTWNYDAYRGWLSSKDYPDASTGEAGTLGPDYTYTAGGRLKTRTWARTGTSSQRILTTYAYGFDGSSKHGDITSITYSYDPQSTPSVAYTYDRLGRQATIVQGGTATTTLTYNDANQVFSEAYSGGTLGGFSVTNGYDQFLRRTNLIGLNSSSAMIYRATNSYDAASRLLLISDETNNATYSYLANSPLVSQVVFKDGSTTRLTTTKQYDYLNRLTSISNVNASSVNLSSHAYAYNNANQRTRANLADGTFWIYEYDALGQIRNGKKYWPDWTLVAGQQFEYGHDDIGNRQTANAGGDENGAGLRSAAYTVNSLNQYTQRGVPGAVDVMGVALTTATVTVNSASTYRHGEYFRKELSVANSSVAVWQSIAVAATGETTVNGNAFVPKTPETFTYDDDGNLTQDGRWDYTWDAENRLVKLVNRSGSPSGSEKSLDFGYDTKSRRVSKTVSNWVSGAWQLASTNRFLYDGWNLMAALDSSSVVKQSFLWGSDLSGSLQGAGGVGGLLKVSYYAAQTTNCFPTYDGNGNITGIADAIDGRTLARYDYGPFGEPLRSSGEMAKFNPFRFSSKYQDDESDLLYYGYRYYSSITGDWLSRDPIGEQGGMNLYALLRNDSINSTDVLGLWDIYNALKDRSGTFRTESLIDYLHLPKDTDEVARRIFDALVDIYAPVKFEFHLGSFRFERPLGNRIKSCVVVSISIDGNLSEGSWGSVSGAGALTIKDCCDYKLPRDVETRGSASLSGHVGKTFYKVVEVGLFPDLRFTLPNFSTDTEFKVWIRTEGTVKAGFKTKGIPFEGTLTFVAKDSMTALPQFWY